MACWLGKEIKLYAKMENHHPKNEKPGNKQQQVIKQRWDGYMQRDAKEHTRKEIQCGHPNKERETLGS